MFKFLFKMSRKSGLINFILKRLYACDIPRKIKFLEGGVSSISFPHNALGVVIHPNSIIGKNVCIQHHVLLGQRNGSGAPTIENNVIINPYSMILGEVTIGENCIIGAGSIVTKDVPPNSIYYNKVEPVIKELNLEERHKKI